MPALPENVHSEAILADATARLVVLISLVALSSCAIHSTPIGMWEVVDGDLGLPRLNKGHWLVIGKGRTPGTVTATYDNGLSCNVSEGTIGEDGKIRVALWDAPVVISKDRSGASVVSEKGAVLRMKKLPDRALVCE